MLAAGESQVGRRLSPEILSAQVGQAGVTEMVRAASRSFRSLFGPEYRRPRHLPKAMAEGSWPGNCLAHKRSLTLEMQWCLWNGDDPHKTRHGNFRGVPAE